MAGSGRQSGGARRCFCSAAWDWRWRCSSREGSSSPCGEPLVTQPLARRDVRWLLWAPALAEVLVLPCAVLFVTLPTVLLAVPAFVGATFFAAAMMAPVMTAVQGLAKLRMRALAAAVVSMTINLTGIGFGPLVAGALSDALRPRFGDESIRYALLVTACFSLWAATHFALGARRLRGELQSPAPHP